VCEYEVSFLKTEDNCSFNKIKGLLDSGPSLHYIFLLALVVQVHVPVDILLAGDVGRDEDDRARKEIKERVDGGGDYYERFAADSDVHLQQKQAYIQNERSCVV
jgi:hypothetical protein